jgi:hypothetical protein
MVNSIINQVSLEENSKHDSSKLLAENDKIQDDLAYKLRNLIANFCDEHFVKYLKENKLDKLCPIQTQVADNKETLNENNSNKEISETLKTDINNNDVPLTKLDETVRNENETSNSVEMIDIVSPPNSSLSIGKEPVTETTKNSDLNLTSSSSLTPPRSSYSSTSSSSSSSSSSHSSPSSDINTITNSHGNDEANKSIEHDLESSSSSLTSPEEVPEKTNEETNTNSDNINVNNTSNNNTTLNDVIDKLEIIDHATKSIKEISTSAELNHHRLQHMALSEKEELQTQSTALEKLWSQILIGADKLEIFGSIHVRSNNVRLFSCLIDEQLHIDNQSFSSASSCVSLQDSCSPKVHIKNNNNKTNNSRTKDYYKYERQLAQSNFYRKKMYHDSNYRRYTNLYKKNCCPSDRDQDFYDLDHISSSGFNHYYHQKQHQKQQKLAKKIDDLAKAASPKYMNNSTKKIDDETSHYPMKKFKAYHSYCSNKRKSAENTNTKSGNTTTNIETTNIEEEKETDASNVVTSLSNLATVAAAAMRMSPATSSTTSPAPVKKSRKSSVTNSVKQQVIHNNNHKDKDLDADTELEIDEDGDIICNNSLIIDQSNGKLNDYYLYEEGEEDFEDTSSVISGTSSFASSHSMYNKSKIDTAKHHSNRRQHSAHSRCSSFGNNGGLSSRSISINGDCMSRSPSKNLANKLSLTANHRSVSPASSLASSSFDYDDEQVYQSYCSTSSFKSDYEDDYNQLNQTDEFNNNAKKYHHHSRKSMKVCKKTINDENNKPAEAISTEIMMEEKQEGGNHKMHDTTPVNGSNRHYHRRKQHLIDAEKLVDIKSEKDSDLQAVQMQQAHLKLQQLPKLLDLQQQQHQEMQQKHHQQQQEAEARKNDDYLARKYKYNRRFTPYNNSSSTLTNGMTNGSSNATANNQSASSFNTNGVESLNQIDSSANNNLYLLASSRHHHRLNQSESNGQLEKNGQYQNGHTNGSSTNGSSKLMSVNSLVDRLSPISDPDTNGIHQQKSVEQSKIHQNANEINILNRINNLSPSSSSSSSSSNKNHQNGNGQLGNMFHHNSMHNTAVLAAAAAQSSSGSSPHSHHIPNGHPNNHHHAQSVAALLANMQSHGDQQHNSQDVAKVLAATLNPHHHHLNQQQHNHHTQQIINRFSSNNPGQSELMAAVLAQQQQQQHRSLLDSGNQFSMNPNGQLYSRYSHLNAAVAAAAAAAASSAAAAANNGHNNQRAHSVESDAHTPSPPATTPANANGTSNGSGSSSLSSSSSSSSSTSSENYNNSKYSMHDRNNDDNMCKKERSSSVTSHSKDPNASGNEKILLVPGFDVYISANDLNACNDDRGSATRLLRNLMDVFFDKSTLAKSSINGTGRITNTLDKHIISSLFAYVKNRYQEVPHSQLTRAATDKCVQTRRNFRKKIKAAQSYFGMFPTM